VSEGLARYDGHADWYDEAFDVYREDADVLSELLGPGEGRVCLDVACGTGRYAATIAAAGCRVVGVDISADQLRRAARRAEHLVQADARSLPLRSSSIDVAVGMYFHTDVEDFAAVVAEIARCLPVGGRFVYLGLHPGFIGPFVNRATEVADQELRFLPGYEGSGWAHRGSGGGVGLWKRVGGHHKTLATFLHAFIDAGLHLERFIELPGGGTVLPRNLAVAAAK
jgi:ubiquinone/menaquinone biosynthesis C-methylase UbiE